MKNTLAIFLAAAMTITAPAFAQDKMSSSTTKTKKAKKTSKDKMDKMSKTATSKM
jgi:hypothetical protein